MKRIFPLLIFLFITVCVSAVPAQRKPFKAVLEDGREVTARLVGDEFLHFYVDEEGNELERLSNGRYALVRNPWRAAARQAEARKRLADVNVKRLQRASQARRANVFTGTKKGLVILVSFADVQMQPQHTQQLFSDMFNKEGFSEFGHIGSVRDYFKAQSYNTFEIDFDVVGPYTLSHEMKYYGENDSRGNDRRVGTMAAEAVMKANADVNFRDYDWDGDGEVDQVYVVYAGYGEASGQGLENTIWPVEWWLSSSDYGKTLRCDGVTVDQFACSYELHGVSGTELGGIGTACHEFSHCLGLPDFYCTETTSSKVFGMDSWSLMDYGCYNGTIGKDGYSYSNIPCGYTAFERMSCGWLTPTELNEGTTVKGMKAITEAPEAFIMYNEAHPDEYYILENRQQISWNAKDAGHGLLVTHVDYSESAWYDNKVNVDAAHRRCTIIPADNSFFDSRGNVTAKELAGDPYPGTSGNHNLTDTSSPAATLYNAAVDGRMYMGKPLEEIKEADGLMSFLFMGGDNATLRTPTAEAATDLTGHSFTAHWSSVEGAEAYTLALTPGEGDVVVYKDIKENSYAITGLDSTIVYTYRVKATSAIAESGWSNAVTVKLPVPTEWTEWESLGTGIGVYSYSASNYVLYADRAIEYPSSYRMSKSEPNIWQFRLNGWARDVSLVVDCDMTNGHCSVSQQYIGYTDASYGMVYVADEVYYRTQVIGFDANWEDYPCILDLTTGKITLRLVYYDLVDPIQPWVRCTEYIQLTGDYFKDYRIKAKLYDQSEADGRGTYSFVVSPGADVASWRYAVVEGDVTSPDVLPGYVSDITNGVIASTEGPSTATFTVSVPSGIHTLLVLPYSSDGVVHEVFTYVIRYTPAADWKVLGLAQYTDDVLCTLFNGYDMVTYAVEVQEHIHKPGLFRMKNPYGSTYPHNQANEVLAGDWYIEIDATDPNKVFIDKQAMGVDWGYGECYFYSDKENQHYGLYRNSVITFQYYADLILVMGTNTYPTNRNCGFRLDLSTCGVTPLLQPAAADADAYYDLQGRRLTPTTSGLYIHNGKKVRIR